MLVGGIARMHIMSAGCADTSPIWVVFGRANAVSNVLSTRRRIRRRSFDVSLVFSVRKQL